MAEVLQVDQDARLVFFLAVLRLDFAFMLDTPFGIWIMWLFTMLLLDLVFSGIHVGNTVDTVHNLDRAKLNATFHCCLYDLCQHGFKDSQFPILLQALAEHCQGGMIGCFLIYCQAHKVFCR